MMGRINRGPAQVMRRIRCAALVEEIRTGLIRLMHARRGAPPAGRQLYPYLDGRDAGAVILCCMTIKARLDPQNLVNPGALGL